MDKEEEWRDCELYPNYAVSDQGNVVRKKDGLLLKQYLQKSGYVYVWVDRGFGRHSVPVHRLVAVAFCGIEGYKNGLFVDHINTIRNDNRACNLRWVTPKENSNNPLTLENKRRKRRMDRREELLELSGQIINGVMSSDSSFLSKLFDRTLHDGAARITVDLAEKILCEIDKKTNA